MALFQPSELPAVEGLAGIGYCNPFLPERTALERQILGEAYLPSANVMHWQPTSSPADDYPNFPRLQHCAEQLADAVRTRLESIPTPTEHELRLYEDLILYVLYARHMPSLNECLLAGATQGRKAAVRRAWRGFSKDFTHYLSPPTVDLPSQHEPAHAFAVLVQLHRAFLSIYQYIIGGSMPIARLRAATWQSIFSHDMRRYARVLYRGLVDVPTLILGPSGSGKELVARAIGYSRYLPFDATSESFSVDFEDFHALNLSAFAPTLIESELFGHRRGAFSGAVGDRVGWLETCGPSGTVFLDEIGDLEASMQVKLLRVLQSRIFQRVGETTDRNFCGKIVAATNRDLADGILHGRFREDLYYRLCADIVHTPTLQQQLADSPGDLRILVPFLTQRIIPEDLSESTALAHEVVAWIETNLDANYPWPGNIRELDQCVRNIMIRGSYRPSARTAVTTVLQGRARLAALVSTGELNQDQLLTHYASLSFAIHGSYVAAAEHLKINWRTVREKLDSDLVAEYKNDLENKTKFTP